MRISRKNMPTLAEIVDAVKYDESVHGLSNILRDPVSFESLIYEIHPDTLVSGLSTLRKGRVVDFSETNIARNIQNKYTSLLESVISGDYSGLEKIGGIRRGTQVELNAENEKFVQQIYANLVAQYPSGNETNKRDADCFKLDVLLIQVAGTTSTRISQDLADILIAKSPLKDLPFQPPQEKVLRKMEKAVKSEVNFRNRNYQKPIPPRQKIDLGSYISRIGSYIPTFGDAALASSFGVLGYLNANGGSTNNFNMALITSAVGAGVGWVLGYKGYIPWLFCRNQSESPGGNRVGNGLGTAGVNALGYAGLYAIGVVLGHLVVPSLQK